MRLKRCDLFRAGKHLHRVGTKVIVATGISGRLSKMTDYCPLMPDLPSSITIRVSK